MEDEKGVRRERETEEGKGRETEEGERERGVERDKGAKEKVERERVSERRREWGGGGSTRFEGKTFPFYS